MSAPTSLSIVSAAFRRELAEHRLNRFLHVHLGLAAVVGLLPLLTPDDIARAAVAWTLQGVLYCLSLSALLLGLSAAHGDTDEFPLLFAQPVSRGTWLAGKALAMGALLAPAALIAILPATLAGGLTSALAFMAVAAAGVTAVMAALGLAVGFWVRDHVRGLLVAIGVWFGLLFGMDLLLLGVTGAPWIQSRPTLVVLPLMLNPLDALRVTVLFTLEQTAPASLDSGVLAGWWIAHGGAWLAAILILWTAGATALGWLGARRRVDA